MFALHTLSFSCHYESDGDTHSIAVCSAPANWTAEEIAEAVDNRFPSEHCQHDYDCCANLYARKASWSVVGPLGDGSEENVILVQQRHALNI